MMLLLRILISIWMVADRLIGSLGSQSEEECLRWNCPCSGQYRLQETIIRKRQNPQDVIRQNARQTRHRTRSLLDRIVEERFGGNGHHVESLKSCINRRDNRCLGLHLEKECRLEGFPFLHQIERMRTDRASLQAFVRDTQQLLSSLAAYVEQARVDENLRVSDENRSLANDIRRIEESGIYQILCTLQVAVAASNLDLSWDPTVARGVMLLGCRSFRTQAPVDNRNYMIFYTLEKLLHRIGNETLVFRTRRDWPDGPKKRTSSADEDMESKAADVEAAEEALGGQLRPRNFLMFVQPEKTPDFEPATDDAKEDPATCNNMRMH